MVTENKLRINVGSEANQSRKKRGADEEVDQANTEKKQKLDREFSLCSLCLKVLKSMREEWFGWRFEELVIENSNYFSVISKPMDFVTIKSKLANNLYVNTVEEFPEDVRLVFANAIRYYPPENPLHKNAEKLTKIFEFRWESLKKKLASGFSRIELEQSRPKTLSCSGSFYLGQKVSLSTNPVKEQSKSDQDSMPLPPKKALRAAAIRIRFADTIVKAKYRKLIDESSNKADVMMRMQKAKQLFERRQSEVKARIEGETRAARLKVLCKERLALEELEEEAKFNIEDHLENEKEMVKLCGGSYLAKTRRMEEIGLFLRLEDYWPELEEIKEEGEIYLGQKVSLSTIPVKEQGKKDKPESKSDPDSMPLSPKTAKALRAARIRIRFADTIVKAKYRKLIDESSNKADVMMRMQKAKQLFERRQSEVKARIEGETRAARLKVRCKERLALEELEEEAKFNIEDNLGTEKEMVKLCGGSYLARTRRIFEELGLFLRTEDYWPELEEIKDEGEI